PDAHRTARVLGHRDNDVNNRPGVPGAGLPGRRRIRGCLPAFFRIQLKTGIPPWRAHVARQHRDCAGGGTPRLTCGQHPRKECDNVVPTRRARAWPGAARERHPDRGGFSMSATTAAPARSSHATSIAIVGGLFFIIGFFTWINGPLITFVKLAFDVSEIAAFLVLMVFYLSYFFLALPASWILRRTGLKKGLALSLAVMAAGAALFGEFATRRWFGGALGGLFVIGGGLALLQTAVNPYISILGPIDTAARRIALMGICNKVAGVLAPVLLGSLVLHGIGGGAGRVEAADPALRARRLESFAVRIHLQSLAMAGVLLLVGVAVLSSPLPELRSDQANATPVRGGSDGPRS